MRIIKILTTLILAVLVFFIGFGMPLYIAEFGLIKTIQNFSIALIISVIWLLLLFKIEQKICKK